MTSAPDGMQAIAERLRQEFDQSFARPPRARETSGETLVSIRIRTDPFALRLDEIGGLFAERAITRLPGPLSQLLGLTAFRGALVPVFDLGALLGYPPSTSSRWLTLSAGESPIGLTFESFEKTLIVPPDHLSDSGGHGRHVRQLARTTEGPRPVVHIPSILADIDQRIRQSG